MTWFLSSTVTIARYRDLEAHENRPALAQFIEERLLERYVRPLRAIPTKDRNGFLTMAAACLLIETLESFYRGWEDTHRAAKRKDIDGPCQPLPAKSNVSLSEVAFCYFFQREHAFAALQPLAGDFYKGVRCGILHQGETTGGWRISRRGPAVNARTINATAFLRHVARAAEEYRRSLDTAEWNDLLWNNFRKKMNSIVSHCNC